MRNFLWQKSRFIFYCLNMLCIVICYECMNFLRWTFNVSLLTFRWNVSNDRRNSSYICRASAWTSEQSNWSSMTRTVLCKASKLLKSVALSDLVKWVASSYIRFLLGFIESRKRYDWSTHLPTKCAPTLVVQSVYLSRRLLYPFN